MIEEEEEAELVYSTETPAEDVENAPSDENPEDDESDRPPSPS